MLGVRETAGVFRYFRSWELGGFLACGNTRNSGFSGCRGV